LYEPDPQPEAPRLFIPESLDADPIGWTAAVRMRAAPAAVRRVCTQTRRVPWTRRLEASSCLSRCWTYFANTRSATLASARVSNATSLPPPL
jgi:hypothetical protein